MKEFDFDKKGDRSAFRVPDGYFDSFEANLMARIDRMEAETQTEPAKGRKVTFFARLDHVRPLYYAAALFVTLLFSTGLVLHYRSGENNNLKAANTTSEQAIPTAEDYLISSLGTYGISQYYVESAIGE